MAETKIQVLENGPLLVTGAFVVVDAQGQAVPGPKEHTVALCRCGRSATKPFCDGTHSRVGFDGTLDPAGAG